MKTFPRRIFYLSWFLTLLLLPACSSKENSDHHPATGDPGNILRIDVDSDIGPFNPSLPKCSGSKYVFPFIYSYLCVPNPEGRLEPDLATTWEYDPKTLTWRIRLRGDARFHNGDPVTAADAAYSILATTDSLQKELAQTINSVRAVDDDLLEIQLKNNGPSFLESIWDMEIFKDPGPQASMNPDESPIGSGPFKFVSRTDDGRVVLSANENYYNGRPAIDRVVLYYIPDREASWIRLIKGQTDVVGNLTFKDYQIIEPYADRFYFSRAPYPYYRIMLYNTRHPLFENPMVRRALTLAIDRDYIVQNILNGLAEVIAGPMGNESVWHDPDLLPLPYDPALALELLEKAGWTIDPQTRCLMKNKALFEFELLLPSGSETDLKLARYIQLCLNDVGIRVHLKSLQRNELYERYSQSTEFETLLANLTNRVRRPEGLLALWVTLDGTRSFAGGFDSPEAARLANLALSAKDPATRKTLFQQFDRLIADLQPGSFLFQQTYIDAMSRRFLLNCPFSYDYPGLYRMRYARLRDE